MFEISVAIDKDYDAGTYLSIVKQRILTWESFTFNPAKTHALLSYGHRLSYTLLYNIYPALFLNMYIIFQEIYNLQSNLYPQVAQIYGVQLDSRHAWTKSDWQIWAAACSAPSTRRLFVNALVLWINETSTDKARRATT
jgi:hypothetical protein